MGEIHFSGPEGYRVTLPFQPGENAMRVAVRNGVPGVIGECGGEMSCGTCHVVVPPVWADRLEEIDYEEDAMLDMEASRTPTSRLSCQIMLTQELDGLELGVPGADAHA